MSQPDESTQQTPPVAKTITITVATKNKEKTEVNKVTAKVQLDGVTELLPMPNKMVETKAELLALFEVEAFPVFKVVNAEHNKKIEAYRLQLYRYQHERTRQFYLSDDAIKPTYLVTQLKHQFKEFQHYEMSVELDKRAIADEDSENVKALWQQIHIVDDIISQLVNTMPAQKPAGWQLSSQSKNNLLLPTVGQVLVGEAVADQTSITSYVLAHFGVTSFTYDKAYFIGHVLGYLFCCYYFAYLNLPYSVTKLDETAVKDYDYASLEMPYMVRLLQTLDVHSKQKIYQLAVICARLSHYATDKRIEKMLIAEVNEFDKKQQQKHLDLLLLQGLMPAHTSESSS